MMLLKKSQRLVILFIMLLPFQVSASAEAGATNKKLSEYMEISGYNDSISTFKDSFNAGLLASSGEGGLTGAKMQEILDISDETFAADAMTSAIYDLLNQSLSSEQLDHQLAWYRSPLGKKITELEIAAYKPGMEQAIAERGPSLLETSGRKEIYKQLDQLVKGSDSATAIAMEMQIAMLDAFDVPMSSRGEVIKAMMAQEPVIKQEIENYMGAYYAYTYQSLPDEALDKYLAFLSESETAAVIDASVVAINQVISQKTKAFSKRFAAYLKQLKNSAAGPGSDVPDSRKQMPPR